MESFPLYLFWSRGCHGSMNILCVTGVHSNVRLFFKPNKIKTSKEVGKLKVWLEDDEKVAILMAEVYIVGQICSAVNFREPNLFIRWNFQAGLWSDVLIVFEVSQWIFFQDHFGSLLKDNRKARRQQTPTAWTLSQSSHIQSISISPVAAFKAGQSWALKFSPWIRWRNFIRLVSASATSRQSPDCISWR